jgi:hypothetical protein
MSNALVTINTRTSSTSVMELVMKDELFACFRLSFWVGFFRLLSFIRSRRASFCITTKLSSDVGSYERI